MKNLLIVVGTRPNFIKVTRFREVAEKLGGFNIHIVHTGQHYDRKMSEVFFEQFGLTPDSFLNIEPASPAVQMGNIMVALESLIAAQTPDLVMVVGDVNSTLAGALVANKMNVPLAHLESGLRSRDRSMPEEINRILTDEITDMFFVTEQSGLDNLKAEGVEDDKVHLVGNTMIDTLVSFDDKIKDSKVLDQLKLSKGEFVLMTIHRPATVDDKEKLTELISVFEQIGKKLKMVFPIHPRTAKNAERYGLKERLESIDGLILTGPLDYFAFQKLIASCRFILTDSGGIQEESTFRQIPCLTLRPNTERPSTIDLGTNQLLELNEKSVLEKVDDILAGNGKKGSIPPLWDGASTERILNVIAERL